MKNYTDSDYALNKHSEGIVYRFANGIVEVTLADYLAGNPDKNEADFRALKKISDSDYLEQSKEGYRQTWKNVPIDRLDETETCSAPSAENELIDKPEQTTARKQRYELGLRAFESLTEVQRRRYILNHVKGLSSWKIADMEGVSHQSVLESLEGAEKKIKKFLAKF